MMPELYLAPALGAVGKPMVRVHTAGSVGGSTAIVAAHLVTSGVHRKVLTVAFEKQSDSNAMWALSVPQPFSAPLLAGAGGYFAPIIRAYIRRSNAPDHIGIKVAVKDRLHALKNPYAHLHIEDISFEMVRDSVMLWDPLRYLEVCPSSDGAAAMVLASEDVADASTQPSVDTRHGDEVRADDVRRSRPGEPSCIQGLRRRCLRAGRDHQPEAETSRSQRSTCRSAGTSRCGWRASDSLPRARAGSSPTRERLRSTAATSRGTPPGECSRRTRSAHPGCSASWRRRCRREDCGGAPGGRRASCTRPCLRRWVAILRDVGGRRRQALSNRGRQMTMSSPRLRSVVCRGAPVGHRAPQQAASCAWPRPAD